jgi:hypothetical protein
MRPTIALFSLVLAATPPRAASAADSHTEDASEALRPHNFARGIPLEVTGDAPLYELNVPRAVYETAARSDLGDVRVFNAEGEAVPHELSRPAGTIEGGAFVESARFLAVTEARARRPSELRLELERFEGTTRIDLSGADATATGEAEHVFYLIDAGENDRPIRLIRLDWAPLDRTRLFDARLQSSDDLSQWRDVSSRATLAELKHDDDIVRRNEIPVPNSRHRYFRLTAFDGALPIQLRGVEVERVDEPVTVELSWTEPLEVAASAETAGEWRFTSPGVFPVSHVRVRPPVDNAMSRISVWSRSKPKSPGEQDVVWRSRGSGTVYRLRVDGVAVESAELRLNSTSAERYWRLSTNQSGLGPSPPEIELGYRPYTLRFLARGEGPFLLAFGSGRAMPVSDNLLSRMTATNERFTVSREVTIGEARELGGPGMLVAPSERDWATWTLWGVLSIGALVLLLMARSLLRQMNQPKA